MTSILKVSEIQDPTNSNTAISIDANGVVTTPSKPMFKASKNVSAWQSFGSTNWTTFPFNVAEFNVGSSYDTTNYKFVAPINGVYAFYLLNYFDSGSGALLRLYDGSQEIALSQHNGTHALTLTLSCLVQLNANDEIYPQGKVLSTNADDWYGATQYAQFTGCLVS